MATPIKAFSGVDTAGSKKMVAWLLIGGVAVLIFWATLKPVRKKAS